MFPEMLRSARQAAGLTQAELAARTGLARPNITAYETGRREPLFSTATMLLAAAGAVSNVFPSIEWHFTSSRRPYAVPNRLWRLPPRQALQQFETATHLWWSGPPRKFNLADRSERARAYEIVLREGRPEDIASIVDGVLLCEVWSDLVLPRELKSGWQPVIVAACEPWSNNTRAA